MPDWTRHLLFAVAMAILVVGCTVAISAFALFPMARDGNAENPVDSVIMAVVGG